MKKNIFFSCKADATIICLLVTCLLYLSCSLFEEKSVIGKPTSITIRPSSVSIVKGGTNQFEAVVHGTELPENQRVTWSVSGGIVGTFISQTGLLTIAQNETADEVVVTATSVIDNNIKGTAIVKIIDPGGPEPIVTNVVVNPNVLNISQGESYQLTATVLGINNPSQSVSWSISGAGVGTSISFTGLLKIGESETAETLIVTATSTANQSISGNCIINISEVNNPEAIVTDVIVSPNRVNVPNGETCQFNALVLGINNPSQSVIWSVSGGNSETNINVVGFLTVSEHETAQYLTISAVSVANQTIYGTAIVSIPAAGDVWEVTNLNTWNIAINGIRISGNGKTHLITLNGDIFIPPRPLGESLFGNVTGLTVVIDGNGSLTLSQNGVLMQIGLAQTVIIRNITLKGLLNNNNSLVRVEGGSVFRLENNALITDNTSTGSTGGVHVRGGTFVMHDSIIKNCISSTTGGGGAVFISSGSFIMQGNSKLRENNTTSNTSNGGGAVFVANTGVFTMEGGSIEYNTSQNGGGGVLINGGFFYLINGSISFNTSQWQNGGGVHIQNNGTFNMYGGLISGNFAYSGHGGGVYANRGIFNKTGGTITGSDVDFPHENYSANSGHAAFMLGYPINLWRNATAGENDKTSDFGFWLCEP